MDQQVVTVDQFTAAMASIQEALASLRQEIGGQQGRPPAMAQMRPRMTRFPSTSTTYFGASGFTLCITRAF
ncbi:hypothetical protein CK203_034250 [Vitis vinifera]|uniref:Uncharacterized protein n=1 Tax=Vitis vinifera TaxID=29760 RepID=A0A438INS9_VITVI|nr:hypothetical protein CK203_034250 [Vitis vinifera]